GNSALSCGVAEFVMQWIWIYNKSSDFGRLELNDLNFSDAVHIEFVSETF
ncbi:15188_t:CDS:2, partial [Entrophospora sp. SA101]